MAGSTWLSWPLPPPTTGSDSTTHELPLSPEETNSVRPSLKACISDFSTESSDRLDRPSPNAPLPSSVVNGNSSHSPKLAFIISGPFGSLAQ